ncbi:PEP/pyruvate-binding domain-containing protein [Candidatus Nanohalococcus occultus]|uniref:pyruvate, water dikinase n=1 Tax=Candidatus Nanohalococcus occultus TaxID=2978047 RepID=A0ABY8CEL6_9ARCH|nr:Phosphoenolpyruvate synthase/pyruvate phosphate dikinase [Candidatus Nanohaloarchaeota archaeon SVXNc]
MKEVKHIGDPVLTPSTEDWGGKGANLLELAQFNNVPPGFIVNADGYDEFVQQSEIQGLEWIDNDGDVDLDWIQTNRQRGDVTLSEIQDTTQEIFLNNQIPSNYEAEIDEALQDYEPEFFTRSSAVNEDGEDNSGAGRLESFGPISNNGGVIASEEFLSGDIRYSNAKNGVFKGIKAVYSTAFSETALNYLLDNDMESFGGVAVPVQEAIDTASGGVIFSAHPNGDPQNVYMELCETPGDAVEDGERERIEVEMDRPESPRAEAEATEMDHKNKYPFESVSIISESQVEDLAEKAANIQSTYDSPMDIEAAYDNEGNLWVLQGRPITVDGYDQPAFDMPGDIEPPTNETLAETETVANHGILEAPALVVRDTDPDGLYDTDPVDEQYRDVRNEIREYDSEFSDGYILVTNIMSNEIQNLTENMEAIVGSDSGRSCHATTVAAEEGTMYMGALETDIEESLEHGDPLYMAVNGHEGELYDGSDSL